MTETGPNDCCDPGLMPGEPCLTCGYRSPSEIVTVGKVTKWQPAETAPLDKQLLFRRNSGGIMVGWRERECPDIISYGGGDDDWVDISHISHWKPLPEPPND